MRYLLISSLLIMSSLTYSVVSTTDKLENQDDLAYNTEENAFVSVTDPSHAQKTVKKLGINYNVHYSMLKKQSTLGEKKVILNSLSKELNGKINKMTKDGKPNVSELTTLIGVRNLVESVLSATWNQGSCIRLQGDLGQPPGSDLSDLPDYSILGYKILEFFCEDMK